MIKLLLLQFQVAIPINHQQQLDMVALQLWEDFRINEMIRNSAKEERDLIGLGEGKWVGYTDILGMSRHKKNLLIKKVVDWRPKIHYNIFCAEVL
jgi:hypothetical protein